MVEGTIACGIFMLAFILLMGGIFMWLVRLDRKEHIKYTEIYKKYNEYDLLLLYCKGNLPARRAWEIRIQEILKEKREAGWISNMELNNNKDF